MQVGLRHAARPLGCLRQSSLSARAFQTASVLRSGPVQKAAAATVPLPQDGSFIRGTVNDPTPFPPTSRLHGSYHWTFERLVSAALVPVTAATLATSAHPIVDGILGITLVLHSHIGFDAALIDYLHPRKFPALAIFGKWILRALTLTTLYGVYEFNTNDVGLSELIHRVWKA